MANFVPVAHLDTFDFASSLQRRFGLFSLAAEAGRRLLAIRSFRRGTEKSDESFGSTQAAQKWPELRVLLSRLAALAEPQGGIEFGLIHLEMLDAGARLDWEIDDSQYARRYARLHLAVRTNPLAIVICGAEAQHLLHGLATVVSRLLPIAAINLGNHARVHLVCDFRKKDAPVLEEK